MALAAFSRTRTFMKTLALLYDAAGHDRKVDDLDKVDPSSLGPEQLLSVDVNEFDDGQLHGLPPHLPVAEVSLEELGNLRSSMIIIDLRSPCTTNNSRSWASSWVKPGSSR